MSTKNTPTRCTICGIGWAQDGSTICPDCTEEKLDRDHDSKEQLDFERLSPNERWKR